MTAARFFDKLSTLPGFGTRTLPSERVNTCNGWGFGGWYGQAHAFTWNGKGYILRDGKSPTRFGEVFRVFLVVDASNCYAKWTGENFLKSAAQGLTPGAE